MVAIPFAILTLYSLWSRGTHAWIMWHLSRQIDWLSLGVVVYMPVMLIVIILDAREPRRASQLGTVDLRIL